MDFIIPVDTGRKLNVHKTFRRRSGRLLNVLYTFSLRPMSTGMLINKSINKSTESIDSKSEKVFLRGQTFHNKVF